jgi:hypothetical protein
MRTIPLSLHMPRRVGGFLSVLFAMIFLLAGGAARAQVLYGSITGTVTDASGAVAPNVTVTVTNDSTGESRAVTADGQGDYALRDVLPGPYTLSITPTQNFASFTQKGVQVEVNRTVRVDVILQVGNVTTQVEVSTAPPILQTDTAEVSHEISQTEIAQLPITSTQGRQFQALYTLIPGSTAVAEQNSTASNPSRAISANFNGISYNGNTTRLDGAVNYYGWLPYLVAYVPPADSIENVNIVTNSFNAEQGVAGGASINVTTKSGTKDVHGSLWEYYQDAAFNARAYTATQAALTNPSDPSGSVPKNVFDEFGFNVGGPVYIPHVLTGRKKLFFFENFERTTRRSLITPSSAFSVPDAAQLNGDFSEAAGAANGLLYDPQPGGIGPYLQPANRPTFLSEYGCNCIPASRQSQAAVQMLKLLQPIANGITATPSLVSNGFLNDYLPSGTLAYNRNTSDTKINYIPSESTQVFGKYSIEPFSITDPQALGLAGGPAIDGGQPGASQGRIQNVGLGGSHAASHGRAVVGRFAGGGFRNQCAGDSGHQRRGQKLRGRAGVCFRQRRVEWFVDLVYFAGQLQRIESISIPRQSIHGRREPELDDQAPCDQVRLHVLSLRPESLSALERRGDQQPARRLCFSGRFDLRRRELRHLVLQHAGRFSAWAAERGHGTGGGEGHAGLQPKLAALDRNRRLCAGSVDGDLKAHHQLRRSL